MTILIHLLATACAVVAAVFAYPLQREIAGVAPDTRVAQMQIAHAVMVLTASGFTWPRVGEVGRARAWAGFAVASTIAVLALVPLTISPPLMFLCSALAGALGARPAR